MDEHIAVKFALDSGERLEVTPRSNLMSMNETDLDVADGDDLGLGERGEVIEFTAHSMHLRLG